MSGPRSKGRETGERPGIAGAGRARGAGGGRSSGGVGGAWGGPRGGGGETGGRRGSAGARRTVGGLGAMSRPPSKTGTRSRDRWPGSPPRRAVTDDGAPGRRE